MERYFKIKKTKKVEINGIKLRLLSSKKKPQKVALYYSCKSAMSLFRYTLRINLKVFSPSSSKKKQ